MASPLLDASVKDVQLVQQGVNPIVAMLLEKANEIDVEKLRQIVELQEHILDRDAKTAFNAAMNNAQREMEPVGADAYNPQTKSNYASYEALDSALRPIYTKHGFSLSFDTAQGAAPDWVRIICDVAHISGHTSRRTLDMPADGKGAKGGDVMTRTHATGSAVTYGQRYLLKMIFNVAVGEGDDDGNAAGREQPPAPPAPQGYDGFMAKLEAASTKDSKQMYAIWNQADAKVRQHCTKYERARWEQCKTNAEAVKS